MTQHADLDFFRYDDVLSEETRDLQLRVRSWVADRFMPHVRACWNRHDFPMELLEEMGTLGCFGTTVDGYGCPGLDNVAYGVVMRELERGDSGLRTMASVQGALAMNSILFFGSEAQKQQWLPSMAAGKTLGCFGLTEPGFGSNPGGLMTTAVRDGEGWRLNGTKMWIGNADVSELAIVWAKVDGDAARDIRGFIVPLDRDGIDITLIENKMSLRIGRTATIDFENVALEAGDLLPESSGLGSPLQCLDRARFGIAWGVLGAAEACLSEAIAYVKVREVFDKPLASYQLVQDKLAGMLTRLTECTGTAFRLAALKDRGELTSEQVSMAKYANVEAAQGIARTCREMLGGVGILDDFVAFRHMANLESVATYEGTRDIHRLVLGRHLTGVQAFR